MTNALLWSILNPFLFTKKEFITVKIDSCSQNFVGYACAKGGAHFPIAHALRLPEPTKKNYLRAVSLRFAPVLWSSSDLEVRAWKKEKEKKEEEK